MEEQKGGLLVVMAHPDDESMGTGGLILRHTRAGIATHLICATYGEAGWMGKPPGAKKEDLAEIRAKELEEAAAALALSGVELWDYPDGGVPQSDQQQITQRIWEEISKLRPRVVVGWGPDGAYGHPDHIAMGACTDTAVAAMTEGERPALYHVAVDESLADFYREAMRIGGGDHALPLQPQDKVDVVFELDAAEQRLVRLQVQRPEGDQGRGRVSAQGDRDRLRSRRRLDDHGRVRRPGLHAARSPRPGRRGDLPVAAVVLLRPDDHLQRREGDTRRLRSPEV